MDMACDHTEETLRLPPVRIEADCLESGHPVVRNAGPDANAQIRLDFDLRAFGLTQTNHASLNLPGSTDADGLSACLYAACDSKIVASVVLNEMEQPLEGKLLVTDAVNRALAAGKQAIRFVISQRGLPGAQKTFRATGDPVLTIQRERGDSYRLEDYLRPIWKPGTMTDEPVFFVSSTDGSPTRARLLFAPKDILAARGGDFCGAYQAGTDFTVEGNTLTLTPHSRIRAIPYDELYPKTQAGQTIRTFWFPGLERFALSPEGTWFQRRQVFFTYTHRGIGWTGKRFAREFTTAHLPKTHARLAAASPLTMVLFGDSISAGANASGWDGSPPFMPSFGELLARALRRKHPDNDITYLNASLGGANSEWALRHVDTLVAVEHPDLVIIAFGMNNQLDPAENAQSVRQMMDRVRAKNPQAEFILVIPMQANALLRPLEPHNGYGRGLLKLQKPGVFVADVWDAHATLLAHKKYADLSGNQVNHPNDFLIRVYAQSIAEPLLPL